MSDPLDSLDTDGAADPMAVTPELVRAVTDALDLLARNARLDAVHMGAAKLDGLETGGLELFDDRRNFWVRCLRSNVCSG